MQLVLLYSLPPPSHRLYSNCSDFSFTFKVSLSFLHFLVKSLTPELTGDGFYTLCPCLWVFSVETQSFLICRLCLFLAGSHWERCGHSCGPDSRKSKVNKFIMSLSLSSSSGLIDACTLIIGLFCSLHLSALSFKAFLVRGGGERGRVASWSQPDLLCSSFNIVHPST